MDVTAPEGAPPWRWRGEIAGGLSGALVAFSIAVPVGTLMLAPLGQEATGIGVMAGLVGAAVGGVVASALGSTSILRTGPMTALALVVSTLIATILSSPVLQSVAERDSTRVLAFGFLCVVLAGAMQAAFGWLKLGEAIKYVPRPVVTGFRNAIVLLILLSQVRPLLGVATDAPLAGGFIAAIAVPGLLVGTTTIAAAYALRRMGAGRLALFAALAAGTAVHHALAVASPGIQLGATVAALPSVADLVTLASPLAGLSAFAAYPRVLLSILAPALTIALIAALLSLLALRVVEDRTGQPADANRELIGQGLANVVLGIVGGAPVAGTLPTTNAAYDAGGRTRWTSLVSALLLVACAVAGGRLVALLPLAALAGAMVVIAIDLFDAEVLHLAADLRRGQARENLHDLGIIAAVAITCLLVNIVAGVALGFLIAAVLFAFKSSRDVVRRRSTGRERHSLRQRTVQDAELLEQHGGKIALFELEGPIFFGTADRLSRNVIEDAARSPFVVLDCARVNAIDATGAHVIAQLSRRIATLGRVLVIASLGPRDVRRLPLERAEPHGSVGWFPDIDRALEWCEEKVLEACRREAASDVELGIADMELCRELSATESERLASFLRRERHPAGTVLFREDDAGDELYLLARGTVIITVGSRNAPAAGRRVATFAPGVTMGELAVIEGKPRTAHAVFETDAVVYALSRDDLAHLARTEASIVIKIYKGLALTLAHRLRSTTRELRLLAGQ
ncbi:MAG: SulP family inorganic anion transporter [Casimicrobiaceae bacterium]